MVAWHTDRLVHVLTMRKWRSECHIDEVLRNILIMLFVFAFAMQRLWLQQTPQPFHMHRHPVDMISMQHHYHHLQQQRAASLQRHNQLEASSREQWRRQQQQQQEEEEESAPQRMGDGHQAEREGEEEERVQREMEAAWRECLRNGSWEEEGPQELFERAQRQGSRPWHPEVSQRI